MIISFIFNFINFCVAVFLTKLLTLGFLFSTTLKLVLVATFILSLRAVLVVKVIISGILSSIFFILALCASFFLTTSLFTTSFNLHKSTGTGNHLSTSSLSTLLFKLLK